WIRHFRRWDVAEAVMVGRVRKASMYEPLAVLRRLPDLRALKLWYRNLRGDKRNDALLGALADELESSGVTLIDSTKYIPDHLATAGNLTRRRPSRGQSADIEFGHPIVREMGGLDIGQSIAVRDREVIAVEAIEGTDAMIKRAGELCPTGGWTLIKVAKPDQDMRFDVPTIGLNTIKNLAAAGGTCLAVEAGRVILLDKPDLLAAADDAGIAIIGIESHDD
ncbi:MAG: UDP-2,3-diacylglucosamine diphosphatase LpxI, partial [Phycisphaeraceae bacterium]|nr:UDP-2,3-diacylglucosamine diphosphatase LpxI [Phycisphaeraceae bacterium]